MEARGFALRKLAAGGWWDVKCAVWLVVVVVVVIVAAAAAAAAVDDDEDVFPSGTTRGDRGATAGSGGARKKNPNGRAGPNGEERCSETAPWDRDDVKAQSASKRVPWSCAAARSEHDPQQQQQQGQQAAVEKGEGEAAQ